MEWRDRGEGVGWLWPIKEPMSRNLARVGGYGGGQQGVSGGRGGASSPRRAGRPAGPLFTQPARPARARPRRAAAPAAHQPSQSETSNRLGASTAPTKTALKTTYLTRRSVSRDASRADRAPRNARCPGKGRGAGVEGVRAWVGVRASRGRAWVGRGVRVGGRGAPLHPPRSAAHDNAPAPPSPPPPRRAAAAVPAAATVSLYSPW